MDSKKTKSPIDAAAQALRDLAVEAPEGTVLGSEGDLLTRLGVARVTLRQAARLVEREGLLRVRRGINGGYFAARPSSDMVEAVVCTYLNTLGLDGRHTGTVTTALWGQVLREAAATDPAISAPVVARLRRLIDAVTPETTLGQIGRIELDFRSELFQLIDGAYVELMFRINAAFARDKFAAGGDPVPPHLHARFVERWKKAKEMELGAIEARVPMMALMAALHERSVWASRGELAAESGVTVDLARLVGPAMDI